MRAKPLIAMALLAFFAASCAQFKEKMSSRPSSDERAAIQQPSGASARTTGETPLAAGGNGGNGGSTTR